MVTDVIDKIKVKNITVTDPENIANEFNTFFTSAGKNIVDSVEPISKNPAG